MARLAALLLCASVAGCTAASGFFSGAVGNRNRAGNDASSSGTALDAENAAGYLRMMSDLVEGDSVMQAEVFQQVDREATSNPTTSNRLKLALALATTGHANSNDEHAERELRELLAAQELLLPEERVLAVLKLEEVERRLMLDIELQQLQQTTSTSLAEQIQATEGRIEALEAQNRELRLRLEDAQQKLAELANIERSIRERESDAN